MIYPNPFAFRHLKHQTSLYLSLYIYIHIYIAGDFCNEGTAEEYQSFNKWLGTIKDAFRIGVCVVVGNHDLKFLDADKFQDSALLTKLMGGLERSAGHSVQEQMVDAMVSNEKRKKFFSFLLTNATWVLDYESLHLLLRVCPDTGCVLVGRATVSCQGERTSSNGKLEKVKEEMGKKGEVPLHIYGAPWSPIQSSPTHPDQVGVGVCGHTRIYEQWSAQQPLERKRAWEGTGCAWRYDEIPGVDGSKGDRIAGGESTMDGEYGENTMDGGGYVDNIMDGGRYGGRGIDVLLTHVPPEGVLDRMPLYGSWGSSRPLLHAVRMAQPRMHLFGHVHAQRGFWWRKQVESRGSNKPQEVVELKVYMTHGKKTREDVVGEVLGETSRTQLLVNSAQMTDRTVKIFAKKKAVVRARVIEGIWGGQGGEWDFQVVGEIK